MMRRLRFSFFPFIVLLSVFSSCTSSDAPIPKSSDKEIVTFVLKKSDGTAFAAADILVNWSGTNIEFILPYGTATNPLTPEFTIKGVSVKPGSGVAQDFSKPVYYTVTAEDGSSTQYTVTVKWGTAPLIYFGGSDNYLYCLDGGTGTQMWRYKGEGSFVFSSPTYANNTIYIGSEDNHVYAIDPKGGYTKWMKKIAVTGIESDAVYNNGTLYVGTNDDYLYALDANTGSTKWTYLTGANISSSPTVENGVVYFGSSDGNFYALNAANGSLKWKYSTGGMINQSGAALVNGVLYFGSRDANVYAVNASDGSLKWKYSTGDISLEQSSPTVSNGIVYIGGWYNVAAFTKKGSLYALNALTGQLIWKGLDNTGISASPYVQNGIVYITTDDLKIHALNAFNGTPLWNKEILANSASPVVAFNRVFVGGGGSRNFYCFDALTGNEIWRFPLPVALNTSSALILPASGGPVHPGDSGSNQ